MFNEVETKSHQYGNKSTINKIVFGGEYRILKKVLEALKELVNYEHEDDSLTQKELCKKLIEGKGNIYDAISFLEWLPTRYIDWKTFDDQFSEYIYWKNMPVFEKLEDCFFKLCEGDEEQQVKANQLVVLILDGIFKYLESLENPKVKKTIASRELKRIL